MPTANERKALWFLAVVVLSGSGVRAWRARAVPVPAVEAGALARQIDRVDSARAAGKPRKATRQKAPPAPPDTQPIDLDRASALDLERLPGIGPALAGRIVANRDSAGAFGGMGGLCEVRGIGPALAKRLRPLVTFSGAPRPVSDTCGTASNQRRKARSERTSQPR